MSLIVMHDTHSTSLIACYSQSRKHYENVDDEDEDRSVHVWRLANTGNSD
jgi:hypothetical protein